MKKLIASLKKNVVAILLCLLIISGSWFVLFSHYTKSHGGGDVLTKLENILLDLRFLKRGVEKPKLHIGILAVDEKSIQEFGRWPFSRRYYEKALINLKALGVSWVGFDAVFSEGEKPSLDDVKSEWADLLSPSKTMQKKSVEPTVDGRQLAEKMTEIEKKPPGDTSFASGVKAFENVLLGYFYFLHKSEVELAGRADVAFSGMETLLSSEIQTMLFPEGKDLSAYEFLKVHGLVSNIPLIAQASPYHAFFSNEADADAIIRWTTLVRNIDGHLMPSLSLKMAALATKRDILVEFGDQGIENIDLISQTDESNSIRVPIDPLGLGRALINHRGPSQTYPHISLADAYHNRFDAKQKEWLKDAILLMGMTAIGVNDQRPSPFDPTLDGVEIHANTLDNIISQDLFSRPKSIYSTELLLVLLIGLLFSPILIFSRAVYSGIFGLAFIISYYYFDKYYWFSKGIWAYLGVPLLEIVLLYTVITVYRYITEEREKKKVRGAFSFYLSPEVIEQLLDEPQGLQLGGVRKELTVFFSDVRGFTTISESLTPEQLCGFMNAYFTPMTQIILKSRGVLDKYIGDAIMAFWGAPISINDHADVAVDSAVQMLYSLERLPSDFKQQGLPYVDMGMGLNTGPMSVGNMGSSERFCYTVMGDSVNLASRIESLTKEYGVRLLISEFTVDAFQKKHHLVRDLDDIRVKGKNKPIKIFHVFRPDALPEKDLKEIIGLFEEGRRFYRLQDWKKATEIFRSCLAINAEDGPSSLYLKRIEYFATQPKIEDWDGVYTFTHK
ncbi:MAG: adenylate/guanylate cyclase domain-containing protein [Oligoflexales bacterium]|nr:adenylate/guanylate cyclase domain-containing protein [Oligoflexales bacterium]